MTQRLIRAASRLSFVCQFGVWTVDQTKEDIWTHQTIYNSDISRFISLNISVFLFD